MNNREKKAVIFAFIYIFIMAIGMTLLKVNGINYGGSEMTKILLYVEIVLSLFAFLAYKHLNLKIFTLRVEYTHWFLPFILIFLASIFNILIYGDFSNNTNLLLLCLLMTVLVGFSEELMFRGIILRIFLEKNSLNKAILISALLFSLLHSVNVLAGLDPLGVMLQLLSTFIFGIIYGCLAIIMKNIIPLIIFHATWDFLLISKDLTHVNVTTLALSETILEFLIVIPLYLYTVKKFNKV